MAVLIPDMEMPEKCADCRLCEGDTMDGLCHAAQKWFDDEYFSWYMYHEGDIDDSKPVNCPLIDVPDKGNPTFILFKAMNKMLEDSGFEL